MKKCPFCGREIDEQAAVCEHCRAAVAPRKESEQPVSEIPAGLRKKQRSEKYGS